MQVSIRKMGNSQGILIPKPILKQLVLVLPDQVLTTLRPVFEPA